jgi:dihydrofolate synthase/folylpolyglutamate synthase
VTAITSIALDHQQYLGSTLGLIAAEKAGIVKAGVPVIVGAMDPDADATIERIARDRGAPLLRAMHGSSIARAGDAVVRLKTPQRDYGELVLGLHGVHQMDNAVVAVRTLEVLDAQGTSVPASAVARGLADPAWPGRLDLRRLPDGREALLDAAHNPSGAASLASYLREHAAGRLPLVFAGMRDKDVEGMLRELIPVVGRLIVTRASNRRSADADELAQMARRIDPEVSVEIAATPLEALDLAWRTSGRIVVAGSIFLLGDVLKGTPQLVIPFENI